MKASWESRIASWCSVKSRRCSIAVSWYATALSVYRKNFLVFHTNCLAFHRASCYSIQLRGLPSSYSIIHESDLVFLTNFVVFHNSFLMFRNSVFICHRVFCISWQFVNISLKLFGVPKYSVGLLGITLKLHGILLRQYSPRVRSSIRLSQNISPDTFF